MGRLFIELGEGSRHEVEEQVSLAFFDANTRISTMRPR